MPAIHCLMTSKSQELYTGILENLVANIPQIKPMASMSDWEPAPRNAFKEIYPQIKIYGCWFHFTQCIWAKTQKLGLTQSFKDNIQVAKCRMYSNGNSFFACGSYNSHLQSNRNAYFASRSFVKVGKTQEVFQEKMAQSNIP